MPAKIENEIQKLVKFSPGKDRQGYLTKLVDHIEKLSDDAWEGLSAELQKWYNSALKARDAEKTIPELPGVKAADADEEGEEEAAPAKKGGKAKKEAKVEEEDDEEEAPKKSAKKTAAKSSAKKSASNGGGPRKLTSGAPTLIKQMLIKNPTMTKDDIIEKLKAKGMKLSPLSVSTARNDFRHALRVLKDADVFNREFTSKIADL